MTIAIDWGTKRITVDQSDLTLVSGTLYEMDTNVFRLALKALEDDFEGMPYPRTNRHNTEVTVAGVTYARTIEIINGYTLEFTPNSAWTVRLVGSNNNFFDVENGILIQNQVQVIPNNSAGLQIVSTGSGLSSGQDATLTATNNLVDELHKYMNLDDTDPMEYSETGARTVSGDIDISISDSQILTDGKRFTRN